MRPDSRLERIITAILALAFFLPWIILPLNS